MTGKIYKSGALLLLTFLFTPGAHAQVDSAAVVKEIIAFRAEKEKELKQKGKSPLPEKERRKFKSLNYFPIDLKYRVSATFVRTESPVLFKMQTTTSRLPEYVKYGEVRFRIDTLEYKLEVYQNPELSRRSGYEDYLFLPFTDLTNGEETYEVGRYIDFRIPTTADVIVDFNNAYNPYCSYSSNFSCPIPPAANHLPISIPVGEKKYKEK